MTPTKKKIIIGLSIVILILIVLTGMRIFFGEDSWICASNGWVQHGHPSAPMPKTPCGVSSEIGE